jgi:malate synthase
LVALARAEFERVCSGPHQIDRPLAEHAVSAADLLAVPRGTISEAGLRQNLSVGLRYLEAWLRGSGCVPLDHLMEDAATAEISRAQVWQWLHHGARLDDGRAIEAALVRRLLAEELHRAQRAPHAPEARFELAARLFGELATAPELADFLTLAAYDHL